MRYTLGVDIGGTKITGIIFDGQKAVKELTVATPGSLDDFRGVLIHLATFLTLQKPTVHAGIGIAGLVDPQAKAVRSAGNNLKYLEGFNLARFLRHGGFTAVHVQNDAKCFALAEMALGQGRHFKNFVGITLGTGIGGGVVADGRLLEGRQNGAGEVGHGLMNLDGDWELLYQGAKARRSGDWGHEAKDHDFKKIGRLLGKAVAAVSYLYDPEAVILGGGVSQLYGRHFLPSARRAAREAMRQDRVLPKILISKLPHAGALGAAYLAAHPHPSQYK